MVMTRVGPKGVGLVLFWSDTKELLDQVEMMMLHGMPVMNATPGEVTIRVGDRVVVVTAVDAPGSPAPPPRKI